MILPNLPFILILASLTGYLTFLTTKGKLTDHRNSGLWKKLTSRGKKVIYVLLITLLVLIGQEVNNQNTSNKNDILLKKELKKRDSLVQVGIKNGVDSIQKRNENLKRKIDTLTSVTKIQKEKIHELYIQNSNLSLQLNKSSTELYNNITGGDSYPIIYIRPISPNKANLSLSNQGDFPLYDIKLSIVDLSNSEINFNEAYLNSHSVNFGNLGPGLASMLDKPLISDFSGNLKKFIVYSSAKNGAFYQSIELYKIDSLWRLHTLISAMNNSDEPVYVRTDPEIPKELIKEE